LAVIFLNEYNVCSWVSREIEVQRAVNLPVFGIIGFQPGPNNKRLPFIKLNEPFM